MTTIKEISIPEGQLKLRWREPYVTDGTNKALAVLDPGAYRGGYVQQTDPISTSFRIAASGEQDNHFLWVDKTSGTALSIRYGTDVLVDMSDLFTGPGGTLPSAQTWHAWIDCVYTVGGATSGKFYVGDAAPSSANAVKLARISMPSGATAILDSYVNISTTYRTVAHVDRPVLLSKTVLKSVSTNKFQLTGKVYLPGGTPNMGWRDFYINLLGGSGLGRWAYTGDDGALIWVKNVYADSGLSVGIASDSEGFILDPWVELDVSQTTDPTPPACNVRYWTRGTLRDLVLDDQIKADWIPHDHAVQVAAREKTGSPTSLANGTVQSQLEALLAAVNDRISERAPESAPASPVLLWRSHNVASDALVTGTTISIYWGSTLGFAVIVGGYISGSNAVRALVSPGDTMVLLRLHGNIGAGPELLSSPTAAGATVAWNNAALWTAGLYTANVLGLPVFTMPALIAQLLTVTMGLTLDSAMMILSNHQSYIAGEQPGVGGRDTFCRLFEGYGSGAKVRIYYGDASLFLTYNASWDQGSGEWYPDVNTTHALAVGITRLLHDPSLTVSKKFTVNFGTGWSTTAWDSTLSYGSAYVTSLDPDDDDRMHSMPLVTQNYYSKYKWAVSVTKGSATVYVDYCAINFHSACFTVPNYFWIVIEENPYDIFNSIYLAAGSTDQYGFVIKGEADMGGVVGTAYAFGTVVVLDT